MSKTNFEYVYPLTTAPYVFVGTKPAAVLFGDERVEVKTWRGVYSAIIGRCNQDSHGHERLMYLRNKAAEKVRKFLSDSPECMSKPHRIDEGLFGEVHYGSQTLIHILVKRILAYTGFDCSIVRIALKPRR